MHDGYRGRTPRDPLVGLQVRTNGDQSHKAPAMSVVDLTDERCLSTVARGGSLRGESVRHVVPERAIRRDCAAISRIRVRATRQPLRSWPTTIDLLGMMLFAWEDGCRAR